MRLSRPDGRFVLALAITLSGCSGQGPRAGDADKVQPPAGGVLVRGAGATFPSLLYKRWFAEYSKDHPRVAIAYDVVGSGEGVRRFVGRGVDPKDQVDFGASDAAMTDEELEAVPGGVVMVPITAGSVVLAYNLPGFDGELRLSRKAYSGIFLGEITSWDDPAIAQGQPGHEAPAHRHRRRGAVRRQRDDVRVHEPPRRDQRSVAQPVRRQHARPIARRRDAGGGQRRGRRPNQAVDRFHRVRELRLRGSGRTSHGDPGEPGRGIHQADATRAAPRRCPPPSFPRTCGSLCRTRPERTPIPS